MLICLDLLSLSVLLPGWLVLRLANYTSADMQQGQPASTIERLVNHAHFTLTLNLNQLTRMSRTSAGILLFRRKPHLQLLLTHPGSPMWQDKDEGGWIIPTGRVRAGENPLDRARQELEEVFGFIPDGNYLELGSVTEEETGESIQMWAVEYDLPEGFTFEPFWFEMEWPPDSGQFESFPEMDRIEYFNPFEARKKILPSQRAFISRVIDVCSRTERE